jgi:hypothetical protein
MACAVQLTLSSAVVGTEVQFSTGGGRIGTMSRMVGAEAVEFGETQGMARLYTGCLELPVKGTGPSGRRQL